MTCFRRTCRLVPAVLLAGAVIFMPAAVAVAQPGAVVHGENFEMSEAVQLDEADNAVTAQLDKAKALLAEHQWDEAVEILRQQAESSDAKLIRAANRRYVTVASWRQQQLAALPPEALKLYRDRVDAVARQWFERGLAERDRQLLQNVVDRAFAGSFTDRALMALGEMSFEAADYAAARRYWSQIVLGCRDAQVDLAAVRARLVLVSILEGSRDRAQAELTEFARLHPDARGRLGDREGKLVEVLRAILAESETWPSVKPDADWPTFAGNAERNKIARLLTDVGVVAWRVPLREKVADADAMSAVGAKNGGEDRRSPLSFNPVLVGNCVFVNDGRRILAIRADAGRPAWGNAPAIFQSDLPDVGGESLPSNALGMLRFTATLFDGKLFARIGSPATAWPHGSSHFRPGQLICLDLAAEGRLLWKIEPETGWAFEGSPLVDRRGVYVAMRRQDIRPQAFVACFDPQTGRPRWRRFICGAETPARGAVCEATHNLLTLAGGVIYYNTNLGAVAALSATDGRMFWVALYPRDRRGNLAALAPHWRRDLNPCLFDRGVLYVAPADSPRIFAFDAATGAALWQTGDELDDAAALLGVVGDRLIASGGRLYWISLREDELGRVKNVWPDGPERPGYGRGVLAGEKILWPTRNQLYIFDQTTARPLKSIDLRVRGAAGGNLLVAAGRLLIATDSELIAISPNAN